MKRRKRCAADETSFAIEHRYLDVDARAGAGARGGLLGGSRHLVTERNPLVDGMRESFRRRVRGKNARFEAGRCAGSARKSSERSEIDGAASGMQIKQALRQLGYL